METPKHSDIYIFLLFVIAFVFLFFNSFYSFCWSDEAFYLSTVHRLYNGERILIDEWSPTQMYAPLILPFYSIHIKIVGSTDGIYLAARIANVCFKFLISLLFYFSLYKKTGKLISFTASILYLLYCRANVLGFSYYSFSLDFYLLGILLLYNSVQKSKPVLNTFIGIIFGFSIISNPFIILIYIGYSIYFLFYGILKIKNNKSHFFTNLLLIWLGTIVCAIFYMLFILSRCSVLEFFGNIQNVFLDENYGGVNYFHRTLKFLLFIIETYKITIVFIVLSFVYCLVNILHKNEIPFKIIITLFVLNFCCFLINSFIRLDKVGLPFMALFLFAFICRLLTVKSIKDFFNDREIFFFILPGFFLALIYQWSSDTGICAMQIGFCVTVVGALKIIFQTIEVIFSFYNDDKKKKLLKLLCKVCLCVFLITLLLFQRYHYIYRDAPRGELTQKIMQGPAKGIYTTGDHKNQYDNICEVMKSLNLHNVDDSIFISSMCPWAYLMYSGKYGSFQTWRTYFNDYRLKLYFANGVHLLPKYVFDIDESYPISANNEQSSIGWFVEILQTRYVCESLDCGKLYIRID